MNTTRSTLLHRVKDKGDEGAWQEFYRLYAPLLYRYAKTRGLRVADAEEVRDQCLEILTRRLPSFDYVRKEGGFKNWLRRIANSKVVDLFRKRQYRSMNSTLLRSIPARSERTDDLWERQWQDSHLQFCVRQVQMQVSEQNYQVFRMLVLDQHKVEEVCRTLALNRNQVYKAKSRVLALVRAAMEELGIGNENADS